MLETVGDRVKEGRETICIKNYMCLNIGKQFQFENNKISL